MIEREPLRRVRYDLEPWLFSNGPQGQQGTRLGPPQQTASSLQGIFARYKGLVAASPHPPSYVVNRVTEARLASWPFAPDEGPDAPGPPPPEPAADGPAEGPPVGGIDIDFVVRNKMTGDEVSTHADLTSAFKAVRSSASALVPLSIDVRVIECVALLNPGLDAVVAPQIGSLRADNRIKAIVMSLNAGTVAANARPTRARSVEL